MCHYKWARVTVFLIAAFSVPYLIRLRRWYRHVAALRAQGDEAIQFFDGIPYSDAGSERQGSVEPETKAPRSGRHIAIAEREAFNERVMASIEHPSNQEHPVDFQPFDDLPDPDARFASIFAVGTAEEVRSGPRRPSGSPQPAQQVAATPSARPIPIVTHRARRRMTISLPPPPSWRVATPRSAGPGRAYRLFQMPSARPPPSSGSGRSPAPPAIVGRTYRQPSESSSGRSDPAAGSPPEPTPAVPQPARSADGVELPLRRRRPSRAAAEAACVALRAWARVDECSRMHSHLDNGQVIDDEGWLVECRLRRPR
jgi:hypothetical protein